MSRSLIAFDTDHIKGHVFGTNKLKEIRGASSILDRLNREETRDIARRYGATPIYAYGGSALFIVDSQQAETFGKEVQQLYHEKTGGGASITYEWQDIPDVDPQDIMKAEQLSGNITMKDVRKLLGLRLRQAKDSQYRHRSPGEDTRRDDVLAPIALPSHAFLYTCESCGVNYAEELRKDTDDPDEEEGRYCRVCFGKRDEDGKVKEELGKARTHPLTDKTLWGRIIGALGENYIPSAPAPFPRRPKDFNAFGEFTEGKKYLGLIYADANNMGRAFDELDSLEDVQKLAKKIDDAVFEAMGYAIRTHLPLRKNTFPFDVLLVGGDDIVIVTPADKALQVAHTLADEFQQLTDRQHTLSVGVVLAPVNYPFSLQHALAEEALRAAKKAGAQQTHSAAGSNKEEESRINFVVVTGNISLDYQKQYEPVRKKIDQTTDEYYVTMRPYKLKDLQWLLDRLKKGNERQLGRTKLHQLREAIVKVKANPNITILESLALLRNWKEEDRHFIKQMAQEFDIRLPAQHRQMGTIFPWSFNGEASSANLTIYRTPLLDFIELYDFVSS